MEYVIELVPGRIRKNEIGIRQLALTVQRRWNRNSNTAHDEGVLSLFNPQTHSRIRVHRVGRHVTIKAGINMLTLLCTSDVGLIFRRVRKIEKSYYWLRHVCQFVRPSVRMEQFTSH